LSASRPKQGEDTTMHEAMPNTNLQESIQTEEYRALREEIIKRVGARQGMWSTLLVLSGTLLTVGVQPELSAWTAALYPLISLCLALNWSHNDLRITQLTWYIHQQVERPLGLVGWESYRARAARQRRHLLANTSGFHSYAAQGVFAITQLLASGIGVTRLAQSGQVGLAVLAGIVDLAATILTGYVLRERKDNRNE
ncbi:MAG: hypothetical protein J2P36_05110, partial [Ktedonobacteraceae bacterium]|nr:hypothetical protein [Ktedonobacteraceae bacterium]